MNQEVRIQIDVSITLNANYSAAEIAAIVERGARRCFPNNDKVFHSLRFAEEDAIYSRRRDRIAWTPIIRPPALPKG